MTTFDYLILGILKDRPLSGYDIDKFYGHVVGYFWSASRMKIYRALRRLTERGWLEVEEIERKGSPTKKLHHLTDAGREALAAWLREPLPGDPGRSHWLGQLFFADELGVEELGRLLDARRDRVARNLEELESRSEGATLEEGIEHQRRAYDEGGMPGRLPTRFLTLHYGVALLRFQRDWLDRVAEALGVEGGGEGDGGDEPG